jgi:FixJ family two-component response regulator
MTRDIAVYVVDDDDSARESLWLLLKTVGLEATTHASPCEFIEKFDPHRPCCIILDLRMPEISGIETLTRLRERSATAPVMLITGFGSLSAAIRAMKLGAVEFMEKPVDRELLLERVQYWIQTDIKTHEALDRYEVMRARLARLTRRERQVLGCIIAGSSNKEIARQLGVSPKAIEIYRANLMQKMEARNAVTLALQVAGCLKCPGDPMMPRPCLNRIEQTGLAG